jgi:hypothetical protein
MKKQKGKKIKIKGDYQKKDTSKSGYCSCMPTTKNYVDIEGSLKKNKEVKEKDVFDFSPQTKGGLRQKKQSADKK